MYYAVQGGSNFERSVDEILKWYHSNKSYWAELSCGAIYYAAQGGCNFWESGWNPKLNVSMGLTVSRQTAKNLTVNRQKRGNLTVNCQKSSCY